MPGFDLAVFKQIRGFVVTLGALAALGTPLGLLPSVAAAQQQEAIAVLGVEATEGAPDSVAASITDAMRKRISSVAGFKLVPGRDLVEVKLVFSCPDEAPSCMAQAAKSLGASKLVFGSVKKSGRRAYLVTLKLLDAEKGKVEAYIAEQLRSEQASGPALRGPAQKWFADLTGRGAVGALRVSSDVVGASIILDGLPIGVTTDAPITLESIPAGNHDVVLSKPGYAPFRRRVTVQSGETASVEVNLSPTNGENSALGPRNPPQGEPSADSSSGNAGLKIAAWSTAALGAASLALGAKYSLDVQSLNSDLDEFRVFECPSNGRRRCDAEGDELELTNSFLRERDALLDEANQAESLQFVFYGASAALLGASAYLFYRAYFAEDEAGDADTTDVASNAFIPLVTPYATPTSAGAQASWSF